MTERHCTEGVSNVHEYVLKSKCTHFIRGAEDAAHPAVPTAVSQPTHYSNVLCISDVACFFCTVYSCADCIPVQVCMLYFCVQVYGVQ